MSNGACFDVLPGVRPRCFIGSFNARFQPYAFLLARPDAARTSARDGACDLANSISRSGLSYGLLPDDVADPPIVICCPLSACVNVTLLLSYSPMIDSVP
jgi:hypothetical protein